MTPAPDTPTTTPAHSTRPEQEIPRARERLLAWWLVARGRSRKSLEKRARSFSEAWDGLDLREKTMLFLGIAVCAGAVGWSFNQFMIEQLEQPYAKIEKLASSGALADNEKLKFTREGAVKLLKSNPEATLVEFANAGESRGSVSRMALMKTPDATYPMILSSIERENVRAFLKDEKRLEHHRVVDFETLTLAERERVQGLALRIGPADKHGADAIGRAAMLMLNIALMGGMVYLLFSMLSQSRKRVKFMRPAHIKGQLSDLVGMEDIKSEVLRTKDLLENRDDYKAYGVDKPTNILFSGPPGTGKTKLAGFLAKELGLPILFHSAANLETGYVAGGSQTLDRILALAKREKRCVVFLDEAQDLFMKRGGNRKFDDDTQNTLLSILDGVRTTKDAEIIWIVASNFNANSMQMDEAMLRRFQLKIDFRLPNPSERDSIFRHYLGKAEGKVDADVDLDSVVHMTEQCSPADIESIVYEAAVAAVPGKGLITTDHLMQATERTLVGNTDVETTAGREVEREIIALHEVGHFLVDLTRHLPDASWDRASSVKGDIGSIKISLKANARSNALGFVLKRPRTHLLQTKKDLIWEIRTLFGGMANEELFFGEDGVTNGAYGDIQEITKMLNRAVRGLGMFKDAKLNFSAIAQQGHPEAPISDEDREVMTRVSRELFDETKSLLAGRKELSRFLADELIAAVELKTEDMLVLIEKFCRERSAP